MHANQAWITMFRRIPANLHDGLTVGLRSGAEIAIQAILKLEILERLAIAHVEQMAARVAVCDDAAVFDGETVLGLAGLPVIVVHEIRSPAAGWRLLRAPRALER